MRILFTIFIFSLFIFSSKAQWIELNTGMENPPVFNDVYAISPDIVVVVGANGTIIKTTDGGETWQTKPSGSTEDLRKVQFPTSEIGYAVAAGNTFLKTTDGGETWNPVDTGNDCFFYSFSCVDENLIFATCSGNLIKSEDGGEIWNDIAPLTGGELEFINNQIGFAWDQLSFNLSRTDNAGETWNETTGASPVHFFNEQIGFYYFSGLYKTTDGGSNFNWVINGIWYELQDIYAVNENNIWGILAPLLDGDGSTRGIAKIASSDSEIYLETIALENNPEIDMFSIHFADETTGYIVGIKNGKGTIWKNGTGINDFPTETASTDEVSNNLFKIYPNPASKEINIEFNTPVTDNIKVLFTDLTGKKMYEKSFSNTNKLNINIEQFPKGTYILSVKTNSKLYNKKIIIN